MLFQAPLTRSSRLKLLVGWSPVLAFVCWVFGILYAEPLYELLFGYSIIQLQPRLVLLPYTAIAVMVTLTACQLSKRGLWTAMLILGFGWYAGFWSFGMKGGPSETFYTASQCGIAFLLLLLAITYRRKIAVVAA